MISFKTNHVKRNIVRLLPAISLSTILLFSCKDYLEVEPEEVLLPEQHYRDKYDADAAVRGIYGKFINLAEQYVILNELRADLMDVTDNADVYLRQINLHNVKGDNPYADPQPFYSLINDCNDVLKNFNIMLGDLKFSHEEYDQRYSDIAALRCWLYFQLVIHYGKVPYITVPIDKVDDIKMLQDSIFPVLNIEQMVDTIVAVMESLPYQDLYSDPSLLTTIDGYNTKIMFIDKEFFLGDLYLWQNNYHKAAEVYKTIMERDIGQNTYDSYKIPYANDPYNLDNFNSGYNRYYNYDLNSVQNHWPYMFYVDPSNDYYEEMIWVMYFSENYLPANPFIDLFSNYAGQYLLKPSQLIMDKWDEQIQRNDFHGDFRGNTGSYYVINNEPVIMKLSYNYSPLEPFDKSGKWFIYRAAGLYLRFCEAAAHDGQYKVAYSLLNNGIRSNYYVAGASDITYFERTNLDFPYDFDARKAETSQIPAGVRGTYHRNTGIRGRVYLQNAEIENTDSMTCLENLVIDEAAMELAFEGQRWSDLVRVAIRREDPSFLANRIGDKLEKAGYAEASSVRARLMTRENWFLPLYSK